MKTQPLLDQAHVSARHHAARLVLDLWDLAHLAEEGVELDAAARARVRQPLRSRVALARLRRALERLGITTDQDPGRLKLRIALVKLALLREVDRATRLLAERERHGARGRSGRATQGSGAARRRR